MACKIINAAETNFPANLFTLEEDAVEANNSNWIALSCCSYGSYAAAIDVTLETELETEDDE